MGKYRFNHNNEAIKSIQTNRKPKGPFRVTSFFFDGIGIRHILSERTSNIPMRAASVYEAHLMQKTDSHNTRHKEMTYFASLYAWAEEHHVDIDELLLTGKALNLAQIRSYAAWTKAQCAQANGIVQQEKRRSINAAFIACSVISSWFISQFANTPGTNLSHTIEVELLVSSQKRAWKAVCFKVQKKSIAPDMTEEEITAINRFLRPDNRENVVGPSIATRDYLMWRMAIEFGMRKGEILAMRTIDCPTRVAPYFKIVRIEERGANYIDTRGNPPRPKTLSRDLGFIIENSVFPKLVAEYVSTHRFKWVERNGKISKQFILPHDFLIITERGEPLSTRTADDIANAISLGTGIDFNWHLARHSFFNRAYAGIAEFQDQSQRSIKLADLVYWGGWKSEKSLEIYTKRARSERARFALCMWQKGGASWTALT